MPSRSTQQFNLICLALCAMFFVGTVLQWRATFVQAQEPVPLEIEISDFRFQITKNRTASSSRAIERVNEDVVVDRREALGEDIVSEPLSEARSQKFDLPDQINLPVPFTSQAPEANWDQPWQDACEEAAVLMLDAYYKDYGVSPLFAKDEIIKMVAWEEEKGWGNSIEIEKVQALMKWYAGKQFLAEGKQVVVIEDPTVLDIKTSIANGHPVLAVAYGKELPNPNFRNGGPEYHALIIRGYTEDSFITNDPGTRNGKNFVYTYEDLMNAIHDWNGGDVPTGRAVVMIVL